MCFFEKLAVRSPETEEENIEDAIEGHREIHFRLLRHDLVAEICLSVQQLQAMGGIQALKMVLVYCTHPNKRS